MIAIDDRTGSKELAPLFAAHYAHIPYALRRLHAGDFAFSGYGPKGLGMIGVERKRIYGKQRENGSQFRDMLSSIRTGRLSGEQLPKLLDTYDKSILIVEGIYRSNPTNGLLEVLSGRDWEPALCGQSVFYASELTKFLFTLSFRAGLLVLHSSGKHETVEFVTTLYNYFSEPWDNHHAHIGIHSPGDTATIGKASTMRRIAFCLSGVGWEKSAAVAGKFINVPDMVDPAKVIPEVLWDQARVAAPKEWQKLDGFGKVLSNRVVRELYGEYDPGNEVG